MQKPHFVVLTRILPHHSLGGMQAVAWDYAREFERKGARVTVLTTHIPGCPAFFVEEGVSVVAFEEAPPERYTFSWWKSSRKYFERYVANSVNVVLSVGAGGFGILPLKTKLHNVPFVMQAHGTAWGEVVSKWRTRRPKYMLASVRNLVWMCKDLMTYRRFDAVVAVGEGVWQDLRKPPISKMLPSERIFLIKNGIDTRYFNPMHDRRDQVRKKLGISSDARVLISASRLHSQKGLAHSLRGFARYSKIDPSSYYLIAGDGPERTRLVKQSYELGIADKVIFLGGISRTDLADFLQASDAFMFLSERVEVGLTLNVLEALSVGLPVLLSSHLCLIDSESLFPVQPQDEKAVACCLENILIKTQQRKLVSALPTEYSLDYSANAYLNLFETLKLPVPVIEGS